MSLTRTRPRTTPPTLKIVAFRCAGGGGAASGSAPPGARCADALCCLSVEAVVPLVLPEGPPGPDEPPGRAAVPLPGRRRGWRGCTRCGRTGSLRRRPPGGSH